jgi:hypothetical protein
MALDEGGTKSMKPEFDRGVSLGVTLGVMVLVMLISVSLLRFILGFVFPPQEVWLAIIAALLASILLVLVKKD